MWDWSQIIRTGDGDVFVLDVMDPGNISSNSTDNVLEDQSCKGNVLIIHGFNGSSESKYVQNLAFHLKNANVRAFGYNYRGAKTEMLTKNHVHIGFTDDIVASIDYIKKTYKGKIGIVGFSMGGILATNFLAGTDQQDDTINFGICVSMPLNLQKTYSRLISPFYKLTVHNYVLRNAIKLLKRNKILLNDMEFDNIRDLDSHLLKNRMPNFDIDMFYSQYSSIKSIPMIKKPFVVLIAEDDVCAPVFEEDKNVFVNSSSILVLTKAGGHLGFVGNWFYKTYAESIVVEFIEMFFSLPKESS